MNEGLKVFGLFTAVFVAALAAERAFVADIVPVAYADVPQPLWAVGTAVMLRALELISGTMTFVAIVLLCGVWAERLQQTQQNARAQLKVVAVPVGRQRLR